MNNVKFTILYVEDDLDDLYMVLQAFEKYDGDISIIHQSDGFKAIEYLNQLGDLRSLPCLIILDINMPGMDGKEVLIRIRQSQILKNIPVVLFTTSANEKDAGFARKWSAKFFTKPLVFSELEDLAKIFLDICGFEMAKRA
jgi:CheY-like chemotaxis protein